MSFVVDITVSGVKFKEIEMGGIPRTNGKVEKFIQNLSRK
jgi:hypothetical protein